MTKAFSKRIDPPFDVDPDAQAAIDAWLNDGLVDEKSDFSPLLELSADVGSSGSVPSELVLASPGRAARRLGIPQKVETTDLF